MSYVTYCKSAKGKEAGTEDREQFITYTIAFETLERANEYADTLRANGYEFVIVNTI